MKTQNNKLTLNGEFKPHVIYWVLYSDGVVSGRTSFVLGTEELFIKNLLHKHSKLKSVTISPIKALGISNIY